MKLQSFPSDRTECCLVLDESVPPAQMERLRQLSPRIRILTGLSNVSSADIVYTGDAKFDPSMASHLQWVQLNLAGVEHLADSALARSGIPVANARGAYSPIVAEFAMGLLLALSRRLPAACQFQAAAKWSEEALCGVSLYGKTLAIVGYGSIGRQVARIAHSMGMRILACKSNPSKRHEASSFVFKGTGDPDGALPAQWFGINEIEQMFRLADHVAVTLPRTNDTLNLIGGRELRALPSHAFMVNVGRGGIVDEAALAEHLIARRLAGAALDVFDREPLDPGSPLWHAPNTIIMPHIGSYTAEQVAMAGEVLIENVRRHLVGEPLLNLVNFSAGY